MAQGRARGSGIPMAGVRDPAAFWDLGSAVATSSASGAPARLPPPQLHKRAWGRARLDPLGKKAMAAGLSAGPGSSPRERLWERAEGRGCASRRQHGLGPACCRFRGPSATLLSSRGPPCGGSPVSAPAFANQERRTRLCGDKPCWGTRPFS